MNNTEYINYQTKELLDLDKVEQLPNNAILKVKPNVWESWDFEKNNELGYDIYKMTKGSEKEAWWICKDCGSSYDYMVKWKVKNVGCPYCTGKRVNHTNSLATMNPQLASKWHPTLNGELTPHDVTCGSKMKVWWLGECNHEWETTINDSNNGRVTGCPYCSGRKFQKGVNDIWTTNETLASLLANKEDGYKYTQFSNVKVDWNCPNCSETINDVKISKVSSFGLRCPKCSSSFTVVDGEVKMKRKYRKNQ